MPKSLLIVTMLLLVSYQAFTEQISCKGKIDFKNADIEMKNIKLQSIMKSGSKGYQIFLHNDGSYQIPIDSSKHTIFLRPLAVGFVFQPKEFKLTPQQLKQHCNSENQKKSFDFTLIGFQIESKVLTKKTSTPIKSIKVQITSQDQKKKLVSTTDQNGIFTFNEIMPETYVMKIVQDQDSTIKWERSQIKCQASVSKNQRVHQECNDVVFLATGFNVMGSVFVNNNGSSLNGIDVKLSPKDASKQKEYCQKNSCVTRTNEHVMSLFGLFEFKGVEQGEFTVGAVKTQYMAQFEPKNVEVAVRYQSVILKDTIKLTHVSNYKVAIQSQIEPSKTKVTLINTKDNKTSTLNFQKSSKKINFPNLEVKTAYKLKVQSPHYQFDQTEIIIGSPFQIQNKTLNVQANRIEVCGMVKMKKGPASNRDIKIQQEQKNQLKQYRTIATDKDGKFCDFLPPNKYVIIAELSEQDKQKGTVFHPNQIKIDLKQKPVLDLKFEQASIQIIGEIIGFQVSKKKRPNIQLSLINIYKKQQPPIIKSVEIPKKANSQDSNVLIKYDFENVGAGHYVVRINSNIYCFEKEEIEVHVTGELAHVELKEPFLKTGYNFNYSASHPIEDVNITVKDGKIALKTVLLAKGKNSFCISLEGEFQINIPQCYLMKNSINKIPFSVPIDSLGSNVKEININVESFGISGSLYIKDQPTQSAVSNQNEDLLKQIDKLIGVKVQGSSQIIKFSKDKDSSEAKYNYLMHVKAGAKVNIVLSKLSKITPKQQNFYNHLIIKPDSIPIVMSDNCKVYQDFFVAVGTIVHGETQPKLKQVKVTMTNKFTQQVIQSVTTNDQGKYQFNPIDPSTEITLTSEKDGYVLAEINQNQSKYDLKMKKLSQLFLNVIDSDSKKPISGVKLLLSSSTSSQNKQHNSDIQQIKPGRYKFNKIKSGNNQRLQVMLRQYQFDNGGLIELEIQDGQTKEATIYGSRVTFSAYGTVMLGDLKKVKNVLVRAKCLDQSLCDNFVHESVTNSNGQFRIEELKPKALYELRVVIASQKGQDNQIDESQYEEKIEKKIQKCEPESITIDMKRSDITDIEFVVKMESSFISLQGQVYFQDEIADKTMNDIINEPQIELTIQETFQGDKKPQAITTQRLTKTRVFVVNKLKRASSYKITLKSSTKKYEEMSQTFKGQQFEKYLTLKMIKGKSTENQEFKAESGSPAFGILLLTAIIGGFIYYKRSA